MKKVKLLFLFFTLIALTNLNAQDLSMTQKWIKAGNSLREAHQYEQSEEYLLKGLKGAKQLKNRYWEAVASEYLGILYSSTDNADAAKLNFNNALSIYQSQNLKLSVSALKAMMNDRDIATDNLWQFYGGIEIGSKGVKYSIIKVRRKEGHFNFIYVKDGSKNTQIIDFTPSAIQETSEAVRAFLDTIRMNKDKIPFENIFIAVSSGVKQEADKVSGREEALRSSLVNTVPSYTKPIEFLNPCKEADLTIKGVMPSDYLYTSSLIDIGSGNTKGGYRLKDTKVAECFSIPWGTVTLSKKISKISRDNVQRFFTDSINSSIVTEIERKSGLTNRRYSFYSGGIYWAMCNYLYPAKIKDDFTEFTNQDINKFLNAAINTYETLINPDLSAITDINELKEAQKQIERTHTTFNQDNLIAGALIMKSIANKLNSSDVKDKHFNFSRFAYVGWISGYIVKKVDDDFNNVKE